MSEEPSAVMKEIGMLNLRINDMMTQLNATLKFLVEENKALKQENDALKNDKATEKAKP